MVSEGSEKTAWRTAAACGLAAAACMLLPAPIQSAIRAMANDFLRPGQTLVRPLAVSAGEVRLSQATTGTGGGHSTELQQRIQQLELALRREQIAQANLRSKLESTQANGVTPFVASRSSRLLLHELLQARVLGRERDLADRPSLILDLGSSGGVVSEAFVVHGPDPVLDQGSAAGIEAGQPVYAGRCVLGRITRTGRWTSAVQLITDPRYSGRAQLLRASGAGAQFGAEGILTGLGDGTCQLTGIPYTEPVAVGDTVYTGGRSARFPEAMYYGSVIEAKLEAGQRWTIVVRPGLDVDQIREVAVLRESLNSTRVLGQ